MVIFRDGDHIAEICLLDKSIKVTPFKNGVIYVEKDILRCHYSRIGFELMKDS